MERSRRSTRRAAREEEGTARPVSRTTTRRTRKKPVVVAKEDPPAEAAVENLEGSASNKVAPRTGRSRRGGKSARAKKEEEEEEEEVLVPNSQEEPEADEAVEEPQEEPVEEEDDEQFEAPAKEEDDDEEMDDAEVEEEPAVKSSSKKPVPAEEDEEQEEKDDAPSTKAKEENVPRGPDHHFDASERVATSAHGERGAVPRLMIQSIELTNFKSYAGKKTIGPFHQRFSAVVGPNGSGKSNLIDALLFVFGYRTKKLRLNKVSELIHNSNHGRGLQSAKVEVFFQQVIDREGPGEEYDILPDSKFSVSRVATADNKSYYYINDTKKTFTDVQQELRKHHIDLNNNRFLILQGEVELISQMKPKGQTAHEDGLLEYIEDIIGTNLLIPAIDEASEKVVEANTARAVQINRVRAADKAMNALESAKEEAEEHRRIQAQIIDHNATLYQLQAVSHQAQVDQLKKDHEEISSTLKEVFEHQEKYNSILEAIDAEFSGKTKEHAAVHKEMLASKQQYDEFEKQRAKLKQHVKNHKSKCKTLAKTQEKETKKMKELQRSLETAKSELASAEESVDTLKEELKKEEKQLVEIQGSLKGKTATVRQEMEVAKKELIPKQKKITEIQAIIDIAESELSMLEDQANEAQAKLEETTEAIKEAKARGAAAAEQVKEKKSDVAKAKERIPEVEREIARAEELEEELANNKTEIETKLDENDAQASESRSQSKVLQACMMLKVERNLGVHGRLGDLGAIDDCYDVAITTACGSQLDQIVVDSTRDAQQCANFLKERQVGRCTFLILERIQNLRSRMNQAKGKTPAPRLFDLITPKSDLYLPAFYSVVRDTLLADDFPSAKRIAFGKQRFRVVTMDGQVIEQSGLLSGGGSRKMKGGMRGSASSGPTLSKAAVQKLRQQLDAVSKELSDARQSLASLREEKAECEEVVETAHVQLTRLEMDAKAMLQQEKELSSQLPELKKKAAVQASAADLKRIKALKAEISKNSKPLAQAKANAADIEETIKSLQEKIMDVGGMPLKIQQAKVDGVESQLADTHRIITRIQVQLKTIEKNVGKCSKAIAATEAGLEEETQQVAEKKQQLEELVSSSEEVKQKYEKAQDTLDQTSEELAVYTRKVEKAKSKLSKLRAAKTDLEMQLKDLDDKIKASDTSKQGCFERLKALEEEKASLYDEFELQSVDVSIQRLQAEDIRGINAKHIHEEVADLKEQLEAMSPNMGAIAEYREQEREFHKRAAELEELTKQRDHLQKRCEELRKKRLDDFMAGFAIINTKLKEMYRLITLEGDAELEFVDTIDPFSEGIVFSVRPPRKSWKNIANLSGGEKTLSSLALVFALHHYKPTPLYFMDEIDAALDFKNVSIVAHYVKERTKNAQFIIISLRNNMFELADRLVGIYKPENCTYSIAITPKNFAIGAQAQQAAAAAAPVPTSTA